MVVSFGPIPGPTIQKINTMKTATKAKAPKAPKQTKISRNRDEKNGIVAPGADTACGAVWAICGKLAQKGDVVRSQVLELGQAQKINPATIATQYARWRAYNGITGRIVAPKAPKPPKAPKGKTAAKAPAKSGKSKPAAPKAPTAPAAPVAPVAS